MKLLKLVFLFVCILIVFEFAAGTQGVLDIDNEKGTSEEAFKAKVLTALSVVPKKVLTWMHILPKEISYSNIPKEIIDVYDDLEERLSKDLVKAENEYWRLSKVKETAIKYDLSEEEVMTIYVKVKTAIR